MKSSDEIKKGLGEAVAEASWVVDDGDMHDLRDALDNARARMADALALIQQLEADKEQLEGLLHHMNQLRDAAASRALQMEERVHQLEAERDAAVEDLEALMDSLEIGTACEFCWKDCMFSDSACSPEWRGVQKEE